MPKATYNYKNDVLEDLLSTLRYNITEQGVVDYRNFPIEIHIAKDADCNFVAKVTGEARLVESEPTIRLDLYSDLRPGNEKITVEGFIDCDCGFTYRSGLLNADAKCPKCGQYGHESPDADLQSVLESLTYKELLEVQRTLVQHGYMNGVSEYGRMVIEYIDKVRESLTDIAA